jgi:hypothetical protein
MAATPEASAPTPASRRARFAVRGLRSLGFGVLIALLLTAVGNDTLRANLVHSVGIAVLCWFTIDLGRVPLARWKHRHAPADSPEAGSLWPGWPLMLVAITFGTAVGFSGGNALAGWLLGHATPGLFASSWRQALGPLLTALVPGVVITYWFYSREMLSAKEAAMQTVRQQAAEHRLRLLEAQLEPHMLFNTLANLRVLIGTDPPRAQAMLDRLIAYLRATLSGSRAAQHTLDAEFARITDYLELMQMRMGERLRMQFDLPEALRGRTVPALLLQPLVENCIKHGLEPAVAGGRIDVSARREQDDLVLVVRDTGIGLGGGVPADAGRFGMAQIRERLATLYGARASLTLADAGDGEGGVRATIRLPWSADA